MSIKNIIVRKKNKVCISSLSQYISIQTRELSQIINEGIENTETFTTILQTMAYIETNSGLKIFDTVGVEISITHVFYIRYNPNFSFTSENWIEYKSEKYKIISIENFNQDNNFLKIFTTYQGVSSSNSNLA